MWCEERKNGEKGLWEEGCMSVCDVKKNYEAFLSAWMFIWEMWFKQTSVVTTENTTCRGGFFGGSLLNRLYRQLLRRFSWPPLYFLICRGGLIKSPQYYYYIEAWKQKPPHYLHKTATIDIKVFFFFLVPLWYSDPNMWLIMRII